MKQFFSKFKSDTTGVMTMEFMVMLPILLMWFAGTFVFFDAFHKWMKAMKATYTISDMLSRQNSTDDNFLYALDRVFDQISHSRNPNESFLEVSHLHYTTNSNGDDTLELKWSVETKNRSSLTSANGQDKLDQIAPYVPVLVKGEYITVLQSHSPFNPVFSWVGLNGTTFRNRIAAPQRFTSELQNSDHRDETIGNLDGFDPDPTSPEDTGGEDG